MRTSVTPPPSPPSPPIAIAPSPSPASRSLTPRFARTKGPRRTAFVLSGGGARGAYEVGVLSYIFGELTRTRGGRPPRIDILCGTSVGAINACFLAGHAHRPVTGMERLVSLWADLELEKVMGFGLKQAVTLPRLLIGGGDNARGLFDVQPMTRLVEREVGWDAVTANLRSRCLRALSISTTEVSTGRTVIWMQTAPSVALPATAPPRSLIRDERIRPAHALASAAIPLLFPPVRLGNEFYVDGGLRQNTPIAPALRLGATHVLAVALTREVRGVIGAETGPVDPVPLGAAALVGKVLNAFLIDNLVNDLDVLARINGILNDGVRCYGDDFLDKMTSTAHAHGGEPYRPVQCLAIKPTEDIGQLAADHISRGKFKGHSFLARQALRTLYVGGDVEADLASYLLFDGGFARKLIDLGRADAEARRDELRAFFDGDEEESPNEDQGGGGSGSVARYGVSPKIVG